MKSIIPFKKIAIFYTTCSKIKFIGKIKNIKETI